LVVQGGEDDVGPKPRPIFTDSPPLILEPALGRRRAQLVGGPASVDGVLGVEAGEVLADDLLGPVALDALGPRVPADHPPFGAQQEDGVVPGAFDQEAETLLAGP